MLQVCSNIIFILILIFRVRNIFTTIAVIVIIIKIK
jgi:hypothetical protein